MNKYSKLAQNTTIFFIANFGSKALSFLFVRFYTELLTTVEYGIIDLLYTTANLATPIITLCITEAVLRFSIDDEQNRGKILTNGMLVAVLGNLLFVFTAPLFMKFETFSDNVVWIYLLTFTNCIYTIVAHFSRGIGKSKIFALSGIVHTFLQIALNILLLVGFSLGIKGYLIASVLSNMLTAVVVIVLGKLHTYIMKNIDRKYLKQMIIYAFPLIPNSIFWWMMQSANRYIITFLLSASYNGLYAVANKIPTLITTISSIFFQAWQISAIEDAKSDNRSSFYTTVFNGFSTMLIVATSALMIVLQPLYKIMTEESYHSSWICVPFLLCATLFSCYTSFLGTNYVAMKKTKGVFFTTVGGAIVNVVLNFLLLPFIDIRGTALATMAAFFVTWITRVFDTRKFVKIKYSVNGFVLPMIIVVIQATLLTFGVKSVFIQLALFGVICLLCLKTIIAFAQIGLTFLKKKVKK